MFLCGHKLVSAIGQFGLLHFLSVVLCERACLRVNDFWAILTGMFSLLKIPVIFRFSRSEMNGVFSF